MLSISWDFVAHGISHLKLPFLTQQSCIVYIQSLLCHLFCLLAGDVIGIRSVPCGRIEWEPATVAGCSDDGITYRIRVFTGSSFSSTDDDDRDILSSNTNSLSFTLNQLPHGRPLKAMVSTTTGNIVTLRGALLLIDTIYPKLRDLYIAG